MNFLKKKEEFKKGKRIKTDFKDSRGRAIAEGDTVAVITRNRLLTAKVTRFTNRSVFFKVIKSNSAIYDYSYYGSSTGGWQTHRVNLTGIESYCLSPQTRMTII